VGPQIAARVAAYKQGREPQEETMLKTMMMIVIGAALALLALTPATEARKAGGTQQENKQDPNKGRAITKPTDKATPLQGRTTK